MIISHSKRFIFIKTAKTAGTSIEVLLNGILESGDISTPFAYPEEGCQHYNYSRRFSLTSELLSLPCNRWLPPLREIRRTLGDWRSKRAFYGHIPSWRVRSRIGHNRWSQYYKFAVERNPWDKVISSYWYKRKTYGPHDLDFDAYIDFLERIKKQGRYGVGVAPFNFSLYMGRCGRPLVDVVIKYENLDRELQRVFSDLDLFPGFSGLAARAKAGIRSDRSSYRDYYNREQVERVRDLFSNEILFHGYEF